MKLYLIFLSIVFFVFTNCTNNIENSNQKEQLLKTLEKFYSAINKGNTAERCTLFADSAIIMPNNGRITYFTPEVAKQWISWDKDYVFRLKDVEHVKIEISGNTAYTVNTYFYTWHAKEAEPKWIKTKNVHIWKLDEKGKWKLHLDIWNSSI